jgi:glycosyltransferase involved in cell wall biosynthesis
LVRPARRDLSVLYSLAVVFVFPSWIEGFGIPLLEAMACGAPVITSDRGACPEVAGDAAYIVNPEAIDDLTRYLVELLSEPEARCRLQERGFARQTQFSWPNSARQTLAVYQQLAAQAMP